MLIFPEIQISGGQVVTRLSPAANNIVHPITPREAVRKFEAQGAERLHILDVDAALGKDAVNDALIREIIASTSIPVQVAGGMRTLHHVEAWFEAGAAHVVLGTLAITNQQLLAEACARYPAAVLANIATKDGYVMSRRLADADRVPAPGHRLRPPDGGGRRHHPLRHQPVRG